MFIERAEKRKPCFTRFIFKVSWLPAHLSINCFSVFCDAGESGTCEEKKRCWETFISTRICALDMASTHATACISRWGFVQQSRVLVLPFYVWTTSGGPAALKIQGNQLSPLKKKKIPFVFQGNIDNSLRNPLSLLRYIGWRETLPPIGWYHSWKYRSRRRMYGKSAMKANVCRMTFWIRKAIVAVHVGTVDVFRALRWHTWHTDFFCFLFYF